LTKEQIRTKIIAQLKSQKEDKRGRKSRVIQNKLFRTQVFRKAKTVMFYVSFDGEVKTRDMIKMAKKLGKIVAVPVCVKNRIMRPCLFTDNPRMVRGSYGVREPAIKRFVKIKNLDLVIVPGVAFDKKGGRLGRGKGCYDYFLRKLEPDIPSIGLAYDFQILPCLPATKNDVSVNRVIFA
jgi:5-formyltetrahydrofolate cyclo-ligase